MLASHGGARLHTVHGEPLAVVPSRVAVNEVLEVVIRVVDGADFVDIVDKVAMGDIVSNVPSMFTGKRAWIYAMRYLPKFLQIKGEAGVLRQTTPLASEHLHVLVD